MLSLRINKQKRLVPTFREINVNHFLKLEKIGNFNLIDYLSVVLDMEKGDVSNITVTNHQLLSYKLLGNIKKYDKINPKKFIVVQGKRYNLNKNFTLGQRFIIEENGKGKSPMELILFILAVNADQKNYNHLLPKLQDELACHIMPEAFFLLKHFSTGKSYAMKFLIRFLKKIKMLK